MKRTTLERLAGAALLAGAAVAAVITAQTTADAQKDPAAHESERSEMVTVRVYGQDGKLTGPVSVPRFELSDLEWQARLSPEQYRILRSKGTEAAFCGTLLDNKLEGVYACVGCKLPLFESGSKFDSGTGWPSFFQPIAKENVIEEKDTSYGMVRTEILCARCDGHLGHVFDDGPRPTGLRYCLNSESLVFEEHANILKLAENVPPQDPKPASPKGGVGHHLPAPAKDIPLAAESGTAKAVFAGGCFWCTEAVFQEIDGVSEVISGYSGGTAETANYKTVSTGSTDHAEAIEIIYDPSKLTYGELLRIHFATHDPTTKNRQGNDVGPHYRSTIFYANDEEKAVAEAYLAQMAEAKSFSRPIVTTLEPLKAFYVAEDYHQDYAIQNQDNPYIQAVAMPKVKKIRKIVGKD